VNRIVLALLLLCLASPALATQVYVVEGDLPTDLDGIVVRDLGDLRLLLAEDGRPPLDREGVRRLDIPRDQMAFLVEFRDADLDRSVLAREFPILAAGERFGVVATDDAGIRTLDRMRHRKERLAWTPRLGPGRSPGDLHRAPVGKVDAAVKASITNAVNEGRFAQIIRELSGNLVFWLDGQLTSTNNRHTSSPKHHIAADYLEDRFQAVGLSTFRQEFTAGGDQTQNVVAEIVGTTFPNEIVVVGGHYDSLSENVGHSAPGAEDNSSGTAGVLHLAEIFSQYETERTIHFVAFGGEEQGLFGSIEYVDEAAANGWNVTNALTLDMISHWNSNFKVIIEGEHAWEPLMAVFESNVQSLANIGYRKDYNSFGSDHVPFQNAGIPAFLAIDWDYPFYADYHRTTDTYNKLDTELGWRITKAMAGALADLTNPTESVTDVPAVPRGASLAQNHPNPFNPQTRIDFSLPHRTGTRIDVYDLAGRRVVTLLQEEMAEGDHHVVWNGQNQDGDPVASGVYVYRLTTPESTLTQRMVLMK